MTNAIVQFLLPEIVLLVMAMAIYLGGVFSDSPRRWRWFAVAGLALAAAVLAGQTPRSAIEGPLCFDQLAFFGRWAALGAGLLLTLVAFRPLQKDGTPEYLGSLLLIVVGLMIVAAAVDLVLLFVALELISIPTYIVLYLGRRDAASQEAATKYFFLSVLASAILLYGFSFLYGAAGSTSLANIRAAMAGQTPSAAGLLPFGNLALVLVFAGLCFRLAAVPFHFYAPDVYQGTSQGNAALLSVIPKAAGLLAMVRLLGLVAPGSETHAWRIVLVVAALTMTLGNTMALWQDNLRRLLAYSSIANAGYMLLALAVGLAAGFSSADAMALESLWFYLTVYALGTIGAFAILEYLGRPEQRLEAVEELAGLGRTRPAAAAMLAVCMFSLAGIPVLAGFWGKFLVFGSALYVQPGEVAGWGLRWWFIAAALVGVLNAAVGAAYYLRIVGVMYFRDPLATPSAENGPASWAVGLACALLLIAVGLFPRPLMNMASHARPMLLMPAATAAASGSSETATAAQTPAANATKEREKITATPDCPEYRSGGKKGEAPSGLPSIPAA